MPKKKDYEVYSQLSLSDKWGQSIGDTLCGPLCIHYLTTPKDKRTIKNFRIFLQQKYPDFLDKTKQKEGISVEEMHHFQKSTINPPAIYKLHRNGKNELSLETAKLLKFLLKQKKKVILEIDCWSGEVFKNKNKWSRRMGHFVVLLSIDAKRIRNGYFEFEYWDPWNGKKHWGIIRQEIYRDFAVQSDGLPKNKDAYRLSNSGHLVLSPYLCLEMPQLDMYSPDIYFAQRVLYLLKSACALRD